MGTYSRRSILKSSVAFGGTFYAGGFLSACKPKKAVQTPAGPSFSMQAPWVNDAEFIGYFIAIANGYYEREKLNFKYLPGGPELISGEVLAAGNCDLALTNIDGTAEAIVNQNAPFKIIGTQYQKSPLGIVTLKENNIDSPKSLVGKRLAVPDANVSTTEAFLRLNNVDPADVRFVKYLYDPSILINGNYSAVVTRAQARRRGGEESARVRRWCR